MDIENRVLLQLILGPYYRIIECISYNPIISCQYAVFIIFVFFFGIWFHLLLVLLSMGCHLLLEVVRKLHFDQKRALRTILAVTIKNCEEMLVKLLAHIWSQDEIILILFVCVTDTESFTRRVSKP